MAFANPNTINILNSSFTESHGDLHFYSAQGDIVINAESELDLSMLFHGVSHGATYDSLERFPPAKCHPGTREEILTTIDKWITDPTKPSAVWLHGPAGSGKSAIAQTICEVTAGKGGRLASFFFARGSPDRSSVKPFVITIAHQLARGTIPQIRKEILRALKADTSIIHRDISTQFLNLIIRPLGTQRISSPDPLLVVIDGLDECDGEEGQLQILANVFKLTPFAHPPLRFIIASRPEPHIKRFFDAFLKDGSVIELSIYDDRKAIEDVHTVLRSRLDGMAQDERHTPALRHVGRPWPPDDVVRLLANRSDGYFIYASTLLQFIDDAETPCTKRLHQVLQMYGDAPAAFAELDKLYLRILSLSQNPSRLSRILGYLLILRTDHRIPTLENIETVMSLWPGEAVTTLRGLHSVLTFKSFNPQNSTYLPIHCLPPSSPDLHIFAEPVHASFPDFLLEEARSKTFFVDTTKFLNDIIFCSLQAITSQYQQFDTLNTGQTVIVKTFYLFRTWIVHFYRLPDQAPVVEYIRSHWTMEFWEPLLLGSRNWPYFWKGQLLGILHDMANIFKETHCQADDLVDQYDNILPRVAFKRHRPSPGSLTEVVCMQDTYTIIQMCERDGDDTAEIIPMRTLSAVLGLASNDAKKSAIDIRDYLLRFRYGSMTFFRPRPLEQMNNFLGDPELCGRIFCDSKTRNARLALRCIQIILREFSEREDPWSAEFRYAEKYWTRHLAASTRTDDDIVSHLRQVYLVPTQNPGSPKSFPDYESAKLALEWLKNNRDGSLGDEISRWEKYILSLELRAIRELDP